MQKYAARFASSRTVLFRVNERFAYPAVVDVPASDTLTLGANETLAVFVASGSDMGGSTSPRSSARSNLC
eukprot:TRINITY_DN5025_c0_g1_i1.p2 TRINITY_DN5025_c0_g1~~TRINITY_DN5025_c0_g1_i1.p2  ORF type:complete len:70 (+),score=9.45 TRINITY_DN5025_c0_g1_i1:529-738(+)